MWDRIHALESALRENEQAVNGRVGQTENVFRTRSKETHTQTRKHSDTDGRSGAVFAPRSSGAVRERVESENVPPLPKYEAVTASQQLAQVSTRARVWRLVFRLVCRLSQRASRFFGKRPVP